jgi:putative ATP-dependent endonuclease of OLD family
LSEKTKRAMITTNWRLINEGTIERIHFNIPKLKSVLGYDSIDKNSIGIWKTIKETSEFGEKVFSKKLKEFLELNKIKSKDNSV